jgi:sugar lactone lactonase YvrE/tetratricopeptide (TPR) repeat protein
MKRLFFVCICLVFLEKGFTQLDQPIQYIEGLTVDKTGNIYIACTGSNDRPGSLLKIDIRGSLSMYAGGRLDSKDKNPDLLHADLAIPFGVVMDSKGNLYISDNRRYVIKKITPGGTVSQFAGSGKGNLKDGPGVIAEFYRPGGMAIDATDNIYVVDQNGKAIRKITSSGLVSTIITHNTSIIEIRDIAVDNSGNLFIADIGGNTIKKLDPSGRISVLAGNQQRGHADGQGKNALFKFPDKLCIDSKGNIYVADAAYIRKITPDGLVTTVAGRPLTTAEQQLVDFEPNPVIVADKDGNAKKIVIQSIAHITCDKNDYVYFTAQSENFVRMLVNGQVITLGSKSKSFIARNIPKAINNTGPDENVIAEEKKIDLTDPEGEFDDSPLMPDSSGNTAKINMSKPVNTSRADFLEFPQKNTKLLASLPSHTLTRKELQEFMLVIKSKIEDKISPDQKNEVNTLLSTWAGNPDMINGTAIISWYKGALSEALLLEIGAALKSDTVPLIINNIGAMLTLGGVPEKAIPVLKTLLPVFADNPMVLNNIGQAYASLGETETAMYFLGRCIRIAPLHPDANNTIATIESINKDYVNAKKHAENSIKGVYTKAGVRIVRFLEPEVSPYKLRRPFVRMPDYFNENKFKLPRQCENTGEYAVIKAEYAAFHSMVDNSIKEYSRLRSGMEAMLPMCDRATAAKFLKTKGASWPPFQQYASIQFGEILSDPEYYEGIKRVYRHANDLLSPLKAEYYTSLANVMKKFEENPECCGEGNTSCCVDNYKFCKAKEAIRNLYLQKRASVITDWQKEVLRMTKDHLNEFIYWGMLSVMDECNRKYIFYAGVLNYLATVKRLAKTALFKPCDPQKAVKKEADALKLPEPECPFEFEIPAGVGSISINCDKISLVIKGGPNSKFKFEKNFKTGKSTLSVGIMISDSKDYGIGSMKAAANIGIGETIFITWDENNNFEDLVLQFTAGVSADITKSGPELKLPYGVKVKGSDKEYIKVDGEFGYRFGIHSMLTFTGEMESALRPAEVQINPNVKIYPPK